MNQLLFAPDTLDLRQGAGWFGVYVFRFQDVICLNFRADRTYLGLALSFSVTFLRLTLHDDHFVTYDNKTRISFKEKLQSVANQELYLKIQRVPRSKHVLADI
jgi:hypothetical protein